MIVAFQFVQTVVDMALALPLMSVNANRDMVDHCAILNVHLENGVGIVKWIVCVKMERHAIHSMANVFVPEAGLESTVIKNVHLTVMDKTAARNAVAETAVAVIILLANAIALLVTLDLYATIFAQLGSMGTSASRNVVVKTMVPAILLPENVIVLLDGRVRFAPIVVTKVSGVQTVLKFVTVTTVPVAIILQENVNASLDIMEINV